jgi:long-chain acyl-CoA synthetase
MTPEWNSSAGAPAHSPRPVQTTGLFQQLARAGRTAQQIAIVDGHCKLTYDTLLELSSSFCDMLCAAGIQPRERVAVLLDNHSQFLVAAFGIWKRGAVLLPLSPQLREAEIVTCLSESDVRGIAISARNSSSIKSIRHGASPTGYAWFLLSEADQWAYEVSPNIPSAESEARSREAALDSTWPAVTQYSTGSMGLAKRVTRSHGQLIGEALSVSGLLHLTPADRILGVSPFFHSYGLIVSALTTLLSGSTLYPVASFVARRVADLIARERLTGFPGVPFMHQLMCELGPGHDLSSLRFVLSAGASLPASTAEAFEASYGLPIRQLYGSTETGVIATSDVREAIADKRSVGFPIPGVSVTIVDDTGQALPAGQMGLVKVHSPFAATDYERCPPRGESYFTADGFFPGDLGRLSEKGELTLGDRLRGFINASGFKVDPGEVEAVLLRHPEILEAVVLGIDAGAKGETVKAVIVSACISQQAVRAHCARYLAPYKCPQIIELRSELPKNKMGKVLRKYLTDGSPAPE